MNLPAAATVIALYRAGHGLRVISARLGIGATTVRSILVRHSEPRREPWRHVKPLTGAELIRDAAVIAAYRDGRTLDRIGHIFGISKSQAWAILVRYGEPRRTNVQGTAVSRRQRDQAIVDAYQSGLTRQHLAAEFGLSKPRIDQILRRNGVRRRAASGRIYKLPQHRPRAG